MARSSSNKTYLDQTGIFQMRTYQKSNKRNSFSFQQICGQLNRNMGRRRENLNNRKVGKIKPRYSCLPESSENQWTYLHETMMLQMVSQGCNWSQIAKVQIYKECGFKNTFIKKQFQTCQRMKIRALTSYFLNSFSKHISDKTLKVMINKQELTELRIKKVLTEEEYGCLLANYAFLIQCRMDENNTKKCLRKKQNKQKYFDRFNITQRVGIVLSLVILKIDNFLTGIECQEWKTNIVMHEDEGKKQEIISETNISELDRIDEENCLEVEREELFEEENHDYYQFTGFEPFSRISLELEDIELDFKIGNILQNI